MNQENIGHCRPAIGETLRVAVYLRVSTRDGRQETDNQRLQLRQLCQALGWQISGEYEDRDSGGKSDRSAFQGMLRDAAARKFDLVLFWGPWTGSPGREPGHSQVPRTARILRRAVAQLHRVVD